MDGDLAAVHAVEADFWIIGLSEASLLLAIFRIIEKQNIVVIGEGLRNSGFFGSRRLISCFSPLIAFASSILDLAVPSGRRICRPTPNLQKRTLSLLIFPSSSAFVLLHHGCSWRGVAWRRDDTREAYSFIYGWIGLVIRIG